MLGLSEQIIQQIILTICNNISVNRIFIYGSRARGDYKKTSDIDIAIDTPDDTVGIKIILDDTIDTLLQFDVVNLNEANDNLKNEILTQGILIYEQA